MQTIDAITARRSVKRFTNRPIRRDEIEPLLELAVLAPNHRLTEPWRFYIRCATPSPRSIGRCRA
jgi:nitroreductase